MLFNLLDSIESGTSEGAKNGMQSYVLWIILGVFLIGWIIMSYFTNKKRKEQAEAETQKRNAIKPGFIVTTIGGIVGTVVAVDDEKNTFVLETGSEEHPSLLKFDKLAIYTSVDPEAEKLANEETDIGADSDETKSDSEEVFSAGENIAEEKNESVEVENGENATDDIATDVDDKVD